MCGIVGFTGRPDAAHLTVEGLATLEYRGYDSAGVAWLKDGLLHVERVVGRVSGLLEKVKSDNAIATAIGHTRWATHGRPEIRNAHPHRSADGKIAIVHNGIIDNHLVLRERLEAKGHEFLSDTDSEIVAHLIGLAYRGDLAAAVEAVMPELDGTFAFAVMAADKPDLLIGARRGSPLAVGLADGFQMLASDATPIAPYTKKVVFLDDDQVVVLTPGGCSMRQRGKPVAFEATEIHWSPEAAVRGGYDHFMLKEIFEQPTVLTNMVRSRIEMADNHDPVFHLDGIDDKFLSGISRLVLLAQGTAYHACMVGRNLIERVARLQATMEYAADFRYRDPILDPSVLVVAVTQSGETMDTLHAVRLAKQAGCRVLSLVNVVGSSIARESDAVFYLNSGPEIGVASTKAFTSMIAGLYILALRLGQARGIHCELRRRTIDLMEVGSRLDGILATAPYIRRIALKYKDAANFLFLGRGTGWPLALEGALKMKEVSYIHAEGYDAAEMKHGPIALVDENMPVLFIALQGRRYDKIVGNIQEVKARRGRIIALASHTDHAIQDLVDDVIYIRAESGVMNSICCAVPLQLLAYYTAVARGCDVDKPKNLAKSVTVE